MTSAAAERWSRVPVVDRFVLVAAGLQPLAWAPVFLFHAAPRVAVTLMVAPLGLIVLFALARRRDPAAVTGVLFCAVVIVAALLSPAPLNALLGSLDWWTGALGLMSALGWWAAGRVLQPESRALLLPVLTVGALWNGLIAVTQVVLQIESGTLASFAGRASGTMLNPVYYGAFVSGVLGGWLVLTARSERRHAARDALLVLALAVAVGLSGGRAATLAVGLVAIVAVATAQRRRVALQHLVLVVAGMVFASWLVALNDASRSITSRVASARGGGERLTIWRVALDAVRERPLIGWGPGNVEIATERQFDLQYTREQMSSDGALTRWVDVHNVALNVLISVGVIGALVAAVFVVLSVRSVSARTDAAAACLLGGAATMAFSWGLQPWTIHTIPVALLLLGASGSVVGPIAVSDGGAPSPSGRRAMVAGAVIGFALLGNLLVVDVGIRTGNLDTAASFARYGYSDAFVDDMLATEYRLAVLDRDRDDALERAGAFVERAFGRYPVHQAAGFRGEIAFSRGDVPLAIEWERRALELQPWSPLTHRRLLVLAEAADDAEMHEESMRVLCELGVDQCDEALVSQP